jgi:hypothetical protein
VWGDAAYSGQRDVIQQHAPQAKSFIQTKAHRHRPLSEDRARPEPHQVEGPGQSRTCVLGDQTDLWLGQSPLPGAGEEYELALRHVRLNKSVLARRRLLAGV